MITLYPLSAPDRTARHGNTVQVWINGSSLLEELSARGGLARLRGIRPEPSAAPAQIRLALGTQVSTQAPLLLGALRGPLTPEVGRAPTTERCAVASFALSVHTDRLILRNGQPDHNLKLIITERLWNDRTERHSISASTREILTPSSDSQKESLITALQHLAELGPDSGAPSPDAASFQRSLKLARRCAALSWQLQCEWPEKRAAGFPTTGLKAAPLLAVLGGLRTSGPLPHLPHDLTPALLHASLRGAAYLDELRSLSAETEFAAPGLWIGKEGLELQADWAGVITGLHLEHWAGALISSTEPLQAAQLLSVSSGASLNLESCPWGHDPGSLNDEALSAAAETLTLDDLAGALSFEGPDHLHREELTRPITADSPAWILDNLETTIRVLRLPAAARALTHLCSTRLERSGRHGPPWPSPEAILAWQRTSGVPLSQGLEEVHLADRHAPQTISPVWLRLTADSGLWVDAGAWTAGLLASLDLQRLRGEPPSIQTVPPLRALNPDHFTPRVWSHARSAGCVPEPHETVITRGGTQSLESLGCRSGKETCPAAQSRTEFTTCGAGLALQLIIKAARMESVQRGLSGVSEGQGRPHASRYGEIALALKLKSAAARFLVREHVHQGHVHSGSPQLQADNSRLLRELGIDTLKLGGQLP